MNYVPPPPPPNAPVYIPPPPKTVTRIVPCLGGCPNLFELAVQFIPAEGYTCLKCKEKKI